MLKIVILPEAEGDIDNILHYTVIEWGAIQAADYLEELHQCFELLATMPAMGVRCDELRKGYRKFPHGEHVIYYRIDERDISITRVLPHLMNITSKQLAVSKKTFN